MLLRYYVFAVFFAFVQNVNARAGASELRLVFPVACELGKTCWIQQYTDHDSGPGTTDYTCGTATYDGHDGTDIRVRTTKDTALVHAAAPGIVKSLRDGVPDQLMKTDADRAAVAKMECGNGVVVSHADGWETQYCHMKNGSITVANGEQVEPGALLGSVGYSGAAAFPHLHFTVRKDGKTVDPFSSGPTTNCEADDQSLWAGAGTAALRYDPTTILQLGLTDRRLDLPELEAGALPAPALQSRSPALVAYAWMINLEKGDTVTITLSGPQGTLAKKTETVARHKAQYLLFAGKKKPESGWTAGKYVARVSVRGTNRDKTSSAAVFQIK